jgi:hypothetical protein
MIKLREKHLSFTVLRQDLGQSERPGHLSLLAKSDKAIRYSTEFEFADTPWIFTRQSHLLPVNQV